MNIVPYPLPQLTVQREPAGEADDAAQIARARELFALQQRNRWSVAAARARDRIAKLRRLRDAIIAHRGDLAEAMRADFGKPPTEVEVTEVHPALDEVGYAIRHVKRWMRPVRARTPLLLAGTRSELRYEPKGVVLILSPWNYPFNLLINPLVAAVAAGNCAILRPSEKVPHTARVLERLVADAFPPEEVAVVGGGVATAEALLELPFDHVFFTGSTAVGRKVMAAAAKHLATVTLELGGKSPAVVDETADVRAAARRIAWGKFVNAGQTCVAPDYVLVHADRERDLVAELKAAIAEFYGATDDERQRSPDFARIVDAGAFRRLDGLLRESVAAGARVEAGGRTDEAERYVAPTLLTSVRADSPAMREEIFGPILPILTFRSIEEVVAHVRRGPKLLAMYVFARRRSAVEALIGGTSAGGTVVNNVLIHLANPGLPFGGVGESGQGSYHGRFGFRAFSHERSVLVQGRAAMVDVFFPPYLGRLKALALRALRRFE